MSFPSKEDRMNCWGSRDEYWQCLDTGKSESDCQQFRKQYEKFCPAQWVKHFDRKRDYLKFKDQIENEGCGVQLSACPSSYRSELEESLIRRPPKKIQSLTGANRK